MGAASAGIERVHTEVKTVKLDDFDEKCLSVPVRVPNRHITVPVHMTSRGGAIRRRIKEKKISEQAKRRRKEKKKKRRR